MDELLDAHVRFIGNLSLVDAYGDCPIDGRKASRISTAN